MNYKFDLTIVQGKNKVMEMLQFLIDYPREIILYGAGYCGQETLTLLNRHNIDVAYICDDSPDRIGKKLGHILISRIEEIAIHKDSVIFITSGFNVSMKEKLKKLGWFDKYIEIDFGRYEEENENWYYFKSHEKELSQVYGLLEDEKSKEIFLKLINYKVSRDLQYLKDCQEENQYFPSEILNLTEKETFLDLGAFDGDSVIDFCKYVKGKYEAIIALEPNTNNYYKLLENTKNLKNITCYNLGAYSENTRLKFLMSDAKNSFISEEGALELEVVAIDKLLEKRKITFIKMDIEGAEVHALLGATQIIKAYTPVLAISVYHQLKDLFEIPLLISKINPGYHYYLKHYSPTAIETILYAIPAKNKFY